MNCNGIFLVPKTVKSLDAYDAFEALFFVVQKSVNKSITLIYFIQRFAAYF